MIRTAASYIFNANRIEAFHGRAYFFQNHHSYMIEHEINSRFSLYEFVTVDSVVVVVVVVDSVVIVFVVVVFVVVVFVVVVFVVVVSANGSEGPRRVLLDF